MCRLNGGRYIFRRAIWGNLGTNPALIIAHAAALAASGKLHAPQGHDPPLRPLSCAVAVLPTDAVMEHIVNRHAGACFHIIRTLETMHD